MTPSELLVSVGSGTYLEDFYPATAISALMRILEDQTLSQQHTMVIQALAFIFKSFGIKSVPYLSQVELCMRVYAHMHVHMCIRMSWGTCVTELASFPGFPPLFGGYAK